MDALALLCNLHADGPLTLQRLRRLGCESIGAVLDLDSVSLERELNQERRSVERFKREAHALMERLEEGYVLSPAPAKEEVPPAPARAVSELLVRPEVGKVLDAWRALDGERPPREPGVQGTSDSSSVSGADLAIEDVDLDGLTEELVEGLVECGVLSLVDLVDADTLELSRDLPLPLTRVRRLQFLARRARSELPEEDGPRLEKTGVLAPPPEHFALESSTAPTGPVELEIEFPPEPRKSLPTIREILADAGSSPAVEQAAAPSHAADRSPAAYLAMECLQVGEARDAGTSEGGAEADDEPDDEAGSSGPFA